MSIPCARFKSIILQRCHADMSRDGVMDHAVLLDGMEENGVIKALCLDQIPDLLPSGFSGWQPPVVGEFHQGSVIDAAHAGEVAHCEEWGAIAENARSDAINLCLYDDLKIERELMRVGD